MSMTPTQVGASRAGGHARPGKRVHGPDQLQARRAQACPLVAVAQTNRIHRLAKERGLNRTQV